MKYTSSIKNNKKPKMTNNKDVIFTDKNNVPLVFYYKKNRSIYYLNPNKNNKLYNSILETLNIV
jgi:nucleoside-triphosphatase THEP1